jgi:hypothetical protein
MSPSGDSDAASKSMPSAPNVKLPLRRPEGPALALDRGLRSRVAGAVCWDSGWFEYTPTCASQLTTKAPGWLPRWARR